MQRRHIKFKKENLKTLISNRICKIISFYKKEYLIKLSRLSQFRRFIISNKHIMKTKNYILFFSNVCHKIKLKHKLEEIYNSARLFNKKNIIKKTFKALNYINDVTKSYMCNLIRKKLVQTIFFKNMKDVLVYCK